MLPASSYMEAVLFIKVTVMASQYFYFTNIVFYLTVATKYSNSDFSNIIMVFSYSHYKCSIVFGYWPLTVPNL